MRPSLRRFWIQITADRKRFGILCAVVGVGLLFWARLIVVSNVPRTAVADPPAKYSTKKSGPTPTPPEAVSPAGSESRERDTDRQTVQVELSKLPARDPFVISPYFFPKPTSAVEMVKEASKSEPKPVEEPEQIEARFVARLSKSVERLKLEAALGNSIAVISGKTYRLGDSITVGGVGAGNERIEFALLEVKRRSVVLECQGRRFELSMNIPGAP